MREKRASCCGISPELQKARNNEAEQVGARKTFDTITLPVRGMTCLSCARRIEAALSGRLGVTEAEVDFVRRKAKISFDPAKVDPDGLKAAVEAAGYLVLEVENEGSGQTDGPSLAALLSSPRPYLIGVAAALLVVGFYLGLITLTSDWYNARAEFGEYGLWVVALAVGLGVQAILFTLLRAWHRERPMTAAKCALATSGGFSTIAMAVCCSHYLFAFLPAFGLPFLSTAAASLADYQAYFFLAGVLSNLLGIGLMIRMMDRSGMIRVGALVSHLGFGLLPENREWR
jgi:Cu+-exporting ATPase